MVFRTGKKLGLLLLGYSISVWNVSSHCATGGGSRGGGGPRTPRYHRPLGCRLKNARRPMGPATLRSKFLRDLHGMCIGVFVGYLRVCVGFSWVVFCLWGKDLVWVGALQDLTPVSNIVCCLSLSLYISLSLCLFGPFVGDVSLFLPLSGAGDTQALVVWVSPCVSSSWT